MIDEKKIEKAAIGHLKVEQAAYRDESGDVVYPTSIKDIEGQIMDSFMDGAHWAINSLWHPNGEEPEDDAECLIDTGKGIRLCYWNSYDKCWDDEEEDDYFCEMSYIKRWCYLSDLLPKEGGEE